MHPLIALVDCNSFYVSCECLFRPDLWNKPVGVLSNNDGCFIARNNALKALGVKMGTPLFQVADLVKQHHVHLFSANFPLYADLSSRIMSLLETYTPSAEIYSIDEAFLDLTGICEKDPISYGISIKQAIQQNIGIPVCVGIGPTKTLAKLANFAAKKWPKTNGVVDLSCPERRERLMRRLPVNEVWGIGARLSQQLAQLGITTVWALAQQPAQRMQAQFGVVLARTVMELNGISCLELAEIAPDKQEILCSRSFKRPLDNLTELSEALAEFCSRAAEKLRAQASTADRLSVFIRTNPFNPQEPQYQRSATLKLATGTQDTRRVINAAKQLLQGIYKEGYRYQKCGIQLSGIHPNSMPDQADIFANLKPSNERQLMACLDKINHRFPKSVSIAATGLNKSWQFQPERMSKRYTTRWNELAIVKCS
ncbi:MAG: Y-family DNA polymerase [Methylococcaceae bacterium]|nr:Y-family DNA polymerase [Methylococcaceae bacterium]